MIINHPTGDPPKFTGRYYEDEKKPHLCPVCGGKGNVAKGFYSITGQCDTTDCSPETCKTCNGDGMVWTP